MKMMSNIVSVSALKSALSAKKAMLYCLPFVITGFSLSANEVGLSSGHFKVDESGAATYFIDINAPAGRAGVKPQVGLAYSSNNRHEGPVGVGWSISGMSSITRCPYTPVHDNNKIREVKFDTDDKFCLDGQRLILKSGTYGAADSTYYTEIDNFSRITAHGKASSSGPLYFTMETKAGETHYYGNPETVDSDFKGTDAFVEPSGYADGSLAKNWAIKIIQDSKGNYIRYHYNEESTKGTFYIDKIDYTGWQSASAENIAPFAEVKFNYEGYNKGFVGYMAGTQVLHDQLLTRIDTKTDNSVFRSYHLDYETSEFIEERTLLESVQECTDTDRTSCLPATTFAWQSPTPLPETTSSEEICFVESGEEFCRDTPVNASFLVFGDTPVTIADSTSQDESAKVFDINGDGYSDLIYDSGTWLNIKLGPDYKTVETLDNIRKEGQDSTESKYALNMDVNGDGIRDLLMATSVSDNWHYITYNKTAPESDLCKTDAACSDHTLGGAFAMSETNVPAVGLKGKTAIMDVNGDGLEDIVYQAGDEIKGAINQNGTSFTISTLLSEPTASGVLGALGNASATASITSSSAVDINGDGRSDLVALITETVRYCKEEHFDDWYPAPPGEDCEHGEISHTEHKYRSYLSAYDVQGNSVLQESQELGFASSMNTLRFADLNGDGLSDLLYVEDLKWKYRLSNGLEFLEAKSTGLDTTDTRKLSNMFVDLNYDGRADILHTVSDSQWNVYFSRPMPDSSFIAFESRGAKTFDTDSRVHFGDVDGDGKSDLLMLKNGRWKSHSQRADIHEYVIKDIINGYGVKTHIDYSPMTDTSVYVMQASDNDDSTDTFSPVSGAHVVSQVTSDINKRANSTATDTVSVSYEYGGLLLHKKGRGSLGFQMLRTTDDQSNVVTETRYNQSYTGNDFAKARMPEYTRQYRGDFLLSEATNDLRTLATAQGGVMPYIHTATEKGYVMNTGLAASEHVSTTTTVSTYDDWGNLTDSTITITDKANSDDTLTTVTDNNFTTDDNKKRLGRLADTTVTKTRKGKKAISRKTGFTYYDNGLGMLHTSTVSPDNKTTTDSESNPVAGVKLKTTYSYDKFGNKTEVKLEDKSLLPSAGSARKTTTVYSTGTHEGRFVDYVDNALNERVIFKYNGKRASEHEGGIITSLTEESPNGRTAAASGLSKTTNYDVFGKVTSVLDAAGVASTTTWSYDVSAVSNDMTGAHYKITTTRTGAPNSEVFYDKWGRERGKRTQSFTTGGWHLTKQSFNQKGLLYRVYEPDSSAQWTQYSYDDLDRVTGMTLPNEGIVSITFDGLKTTTNDARSKNSHVTKNAFGETHKTEDHDGNTVTFDYDSFGNVLSSTVEGKDKQTSVTSALYDKWGNKYQTTDPVKGTWHYTYNAFGELHTQTNANDHQFTFTYDQLGRKTRSYNVTEGTLCWVYGTDAASHNIGKLHYSYKYEGQSKTCGASDASSQASIHKSFSYNNKGLPSGVTTRIKNGNTYDSYTQSQTYDAHARPQDTTYPQGNSTVTITNVYNANGYLHQVKQGETILKTIDEMTARLQIKKVTYNNDVEVDHTFFADTGWLDDKTVRHNTTTLYELDNAWDKVGNLETRESKYIDVSGTQSQYSETYTYDNLSRLTDRTITFTDARNILPEAFKAAQEYKYDSLGNITSKTGTGHYAYDEDNPGGIADRVYRLTGIYDNSAHTGDKLYDFSYDNNGNILSDGNRSFTYGSFDKPIFINLLDGTASSRMEYGVDRELYRKEDCFYDDQERMTTITSTYVGAYEKVHRTGGEGDLTEHKFYIGEIVITQRSNGTEDTFYMHSDHQGSNVLITDESGKAVSEAIYDPFGKRTTIHQTSLLANMTILPPTDRGYTGHKHIDALDIIHMGGRIYDPTLGRFLQADPFIQAPTNSQNYNRFSYVLNNPMSYTDPSGYFFKKLLGGLFGTKILKALAKVPILNAAVQIAVGIACGPAAAACLAAYSGLQTYAVTGSLGAGLRAGAISYISAKAFQKIGKAFDGKGGKFWTTNGPGHIASHAVTGGVASVLRGGKFGHGFFSAGVTKGLTPHFEGIGGTDFEVGDYNVAEAMIAGALGGTISELTGGKFANGAVTAAMGNLFNNQKSRIKASEQQKLTEEKQKAVDLAVDIAKNDALSQMELCKTEGACWTKITVSDPLTLEQARIMNETDYFHGGGNALMENTTLLILSPGKYLSAAILGGNTYLYFTRVPHTWETGDIHIQVHMVDSNLMIDNFITTQIVIRANNDLIRPIRPNYH